MNNSNYTLPPKYKINEALEFFLCEGINERHKVTLMEEGDKLGQVNILIKKMVESISNRINLIDTRGIDSSKGDIKKVKGWNEVTSAIKQLHNLSEEREIIMKLVELENNLIKYRSEFSKGYSSNNNYLIWLYQVAVMDLFYGTMLFISTSVDPIKIRSGFQIRINVNSSLSRNYVFNNIDKINTSFRDGKFQDFFKNKDKELINEIGPLAAIALVPFAIATLFTFIFLIREAVLFFFNSRKWVAREFDIIKDYLELSAATNDNKKNAKEQEKLAIKIGKVADIIRVKNDLSVKDSQDTIRKEINSEYKEADLPAPKNLSSSSLI